MRDDPPQRTDLLAPPRPRAAPKPRLADEGILSARDLATAFQLDFTPAAQGRPGGLRRVGLAIALLILSVSAILLIVSPRSRDAAHVWMSETSTAMRRVVTGRGAAVNAPANAPVDFGVNAEPLDSASAKASSARPSSAEPSPAESSSAVAASGIVAASPPTQPSSPPVKLAPTPPDPVVVLAVPEPETRPAAPDPEPAAAEAKPAAQPPISTPTPQITIAPVPSAPRVEPATRDQPQRADGPASEPAKDPPVARVTAAPIDSGKVSEQAITLWRQALDAEARRDYAKAIEHYEAIKKLPRATWPAGLEINLEYAKKRVN